MSSLEHEPTNFNDSLLLTRQVSAGEVCFNLTNLTNITWWRTKREREKLNKK